MDFDQIGPDSQGRLFKNFPSALRREFGKRNLEEYRSEIPLLERCAVGGLHRKSNGDGLTSFIEIPGWGSGEIAIAEFEHADLGKRVLSIRS
jgi:hypothetical protein